MKTNLNDLLEDDFINNVDIDKDNVYDTIFDLFLPIETRIDALEKYQLYFNDDIVSVINQLNVKYLIVNTDLMKEYLVSICINSDIVPELKLDIAKSLTGSENKDNTGYDIIHKILFENDDLPTPCYIDGLIYWMQADKDKYQNHILQCVYDFLDNDFIEAEYKFKSLLSIHSEYPLYGQISLLYFMNTNTYIMFKILAGQLLLQDKYEVNKVNKYLLSYCADEDLDYNLRADAADCLLHLCEDEDIKEQARACIIALAGQGRTVYDNAQNVHNIKIEESIDKIIHDIIKTPIHIQYKDAKDDILKLVEEFKFNEEYVNVALQRIELDQKLYGEYNIKLEKLFLLVWNYINQFCKDDLLELKKRMIEELIDMANTCSSGHSSRLVNVLTGFTDLKITISYEDQIIANLQARLFKILKDTDKLTEDEKALVTTEFLSDSELDKPYFNKFFRENYGYIKEEMWKEFCVDNKLLSDEEFDNIMSIAVIKFTYG